MTPSPRDRGPAVPLVTRFLLDAQDVFLRAADHLPAPGRGGPIGRLNAAGWVIAHLATIHDLWINVLVGGQPADPWAADVQQRQAAATLAQPLPIPFAEARDAFVRIAARATTTVEALDPDGFERLVETRFGPTVVGYLVARAPAHLLVHAGELAVLGALVTAEDPGLTGALPRTDGPVADRDEANADLAPLVVQIGRAHV